MCTCEKNRPCGVHRPRCSARDCGGSALYRDTQSAAVYCSRHRGLAIGGAPLIEDGAN